MSERHWHWKFVAYNGEPSAKEIHWGVIITVIGYLCEADARIAAQDIVQREQYVLQVVYECNTCGFQSDMSSAMRDIAKNA